MKVKLVLTIVIAITTVTIISYFQAIKSADKIIHPVKNELQKVSCKLHLFRFKKGQFTNYYNGFGWKVAYNTEQYFTHDVNIYVSIFGEVEMTNPTDLKERIQRQINN